MSSTVDTPVSEPAPDAHSTVDPVREGCAVGPDGELLPANKILFYNDPDDDTPLAPTPGSSTQSSSSVVKNAFDLLGKPVDKPQPRKNAPKPALFVAGARRTPRERKPRPDDPNNAEVDRLSTLFVLLILMAIANNIV